MDEAPPGYKTSLNHMLLLLRKIDEKSVDLLLCLGLLVEDLLEDGFVTAVFSFLERPGCTQKILFGDARCQRSQILLIIFFFRGKKDEKIHRSFVFCDLSEPSAAAVHKNDLLRCVTTQPLSMTDTRFRNDVDRLTPRLACFAEILNFLRVVCRRDEPMSRVVEREIDRLLSSVADARYYAASEKESGEPFPFYAETWWECGDAGWRPGFRYENVRRLFSAKTHDDLCYHNKVFVAQTLRNGTAVPVLTELIPNIGSVEHARIFLAILDGLVSLEKTDADRLIGTVRRRVWTLEIQKQMDRAVEILASKVL
ncbi:hypothetical protein EBZ80_22310 [bacterium]|nr:hypothetical protein [bacterium]